MWIVPIAIRSRSITLFPTAENIFRIWRFFPSCIFISTRLLFPNVLKGYELTFKKVLKQPGQFASEEKVQVIGPKGSFPGIRVLGPLRKDTQLELALTDCRQIGIDAPIRESGNVKGTRETYRRCSLMTPRSPLRRP